MRLHYASMNVGAPKSVPSKLGKGWGADSYLTGNNIERYLFKIPPLDKTISYPCMNATSPLASEILGMHYYARKDGSI